MNGGPQKWKKTLIQAEEFENLVFLRGRLQDWTSFGAYFSKKCWNQRYMLARFDFCFSPHLNKCRNSLWFQEALRPGTICCWTTASAVVIWSFFKSHHHSDAAWFAVIRPFTRTRTETFARWLAGSLESCETRTSHWFPQVVHFPILYSQLGFWGVLEQANRTLNVSVLAASWIISAPFPRNPSWPVTLIDS